MKTILNLHVHSFADIITNSSSELFVCNTDKTKEQIKEMLDLLAQVTDGHGVGSIEVFEGLDGLKKVIKDIDLCYLDGGSGFSSIIRCFVPYDIDLEMPKFTYKWDSFWDPDDTPEQRQAKWDNHKKEEEAQMQSLLDWIDDNSELLSQYVKFVTTLHSDGDNSIPYSLFDILESKLQATRFHLG